MTTPRISTTIALCSAIVVSAAALAQDNYGARVEQTQEKMQFTFGAGFEFQFSSNIANGGDMDVYRFDFGLAAKTALNDEWDLRMLVGYELDKYQFAGVTTFGGPDPWDDVHQVSFGGIFTYRPSNEWSLFGGPVFQFAAEESADLSDGFIGGGVFGATYELAEDFTVGGGIGVVTQIEDSARFFPIIIVNWRMTDELRLSSSTGSSASGRTGIELVYDLGQDWEAAIGASHEFMRFRLDDTGVAPDGVGEEQSTPVWLRFSYDVNENTRINVYGGMVLDGELTLENSSGLGLGKDDYDPSGLVGISATFRF